MTKLAALWHLFKAGQQVADPAFWHKTQAIGQPVIAALLGGIVVLLKGTPYAIPIDDNTLGAIAGGLFMVVNGVLTVIASPHLGFPDKGAAGQPADATAPAAAMQGRGEANAGPFEPDHG
jgi:hypothetical protein